jgi:LacI family transcriptional regulator
MIKGPRFASTSNERYQGYLDVLKEKKVPINKDLITQGSYSQESGYENAKQLMKLPNPPDAIFCCDDEIALGAMKALSEMDLHVPKDVAMVGFDDSMISSHPQIQLTTVSQDVKLMGKLCTKYVVNRIENKADSTQQTILEPHLIIRGTCGFSQNRTSKNQ